MRGSLHRRPLAIALSGFGLGGAIVAIAQEAPSRGNDIEVIARKLKMVRIDYTANGGHLKRCDVTLSSGVPMIDRTMCGLLRSCLETGETGRDRAMRCVNRRLDALTDGREQPPAVLPDVALDRASSPNGALAKQEAAAADDIVVTGRRSILRAGMWAFTELVWTRERGGRPEGPYGRQWRACVPRRQSNGGFARVLERQQALGATVDLPAECSWRISVAGHGLTGRQRCAWGTGLRSGEMTGSFSDERLEVSKQRHWRNPGRGARVDADYEVTAVRERDC